eukprot:TRINITY_DN2596_c0_g1_i3.p1 TRINITY_DN2596_c0_g1~~TRINITY_DN2596_c0_g1_i3.p1  ORF type:complete len:120 (+),score=30.75 TRINITY_DN2596_c0_g1_i3:35-394(+)
MNPSHQNEVYKLLLQIIPKSEEGKQCLNLIMKMIHNISSNLQQEKFRKISSENENFKTKVLKIPSIEKALTLIGFTLQDKSYVFTKENEIYLQTSMNGLSLANIFLFPQPSNVSQRSLQ